MMVVAVYSALKFTIERARIGGHSDKDIVTALLMEATKKIEGNEDFYLDFYKQAQETIINKLKE